MAKNWIKGAIKKPGALTAAAKRAGKSISEYCKNPPSKLAKQRCNLAKTLKSFKAGGQVQGCGCPYDMQVGPNNIL